MSQIINDIKNMTINKKALFQSATNIALVITREKKPYEAIFKLSAIFSKYLVNKFEGIDLRLPDESFGPIKPLFKDDYDDF